MKAYDILANYMRISRPVMFKCCCIVWKANSSHIVGQCIEPDIDDMVWIAWKRYAPGLPGRIDTSGYGKISQPLTNHPYYLRLPYSRYNKIWMHLNVRKQSITVLRECEKVVLL